MSWFRKKKEPLEEYVEPVITLQLKKIYAEQFVNNLAYFFTGDMHKTTRHALKEVLFDKLKELENEEDS